MAESKYADGESGGCTCNEKEPPKDPKDPKKDKYPRPDENASIRRLIKVLEEELETEPYAENEAVTSFRTDLKDADKEYQGIDAVVSSYRKYYDKLECGPLPDARQWKEDLGAWCKEKAAGAAGDIATLRKQYDKKEQLFCCEWLKLRTQLFGQSDCLSQAAKTVSDAKDDYEAHKGFEKTLTARFAELKSLYDKAVKLRTDGKHQSVCAVGLEYVEVYGDLGVVPTWKYQQDECKKSGSDYPATSSAKEPAAEKSQPAAEKSQPTPDEFAKGLKAALRKLIEEKYQHFRWSHEKLETVAASKKNKDACDKARSTRRDEFIQEAQDVKAAPEEAQDVKTAPESAAPATPAAPSPAAQLTSTTYEEQV